MHLRTENGVNANGDRQASIIIENERSGRVFRGMIHKTSRSELFLESDYPLPPGTIIKLHSIHLKASFGSFFLAEVKSCEKIKELHDPCPYGIRACFCTDADYTKFIRRGLRVILGGKKDVDIR